MKISKAEYQHRRQRFLAHLPKDAIAILPTHTVKHKSWDADYVFQPHNDFYYLTGFNEPNAVAVFVPGYAEGEFILFNQVRDHTNEIWTGFRAGQEGAVADYGADVAFSIAALNEKLPELFNGRQVLYYAFGRHPEFEKNLFDLMNQTRAKVRRGFSIPEQIVNPEMILHEMRLVKSQEEVAILRQVAQISVEAHKKAMKVCKPGMNEYQISAELMYEFMRHGCAGAAYDNIVAGGANGVCLHYHENGSELKNGDLLLIDAGGDYQYYSADITTTFPINGQFTAEQKSIYDLVLTSHHEALKLMKPGTLWFDIQNKIYEVMTHGLIELGILKGDFEKLLAEREVFQFYMHNSGHWLGLDTHDVGIYKVNQSWRPLMVGMTLTLEPGLYFDAKVPGLDPKWHNIAVRIEDDLLITETGYEILSAGLPRTTEEIEAFMAAS